jgi:hypothetical protein
MMSHTDMKAFHVYCDNPECGERLDNDTLMNRQPIPYQFIGRIRRIIALDEYWYECVRCHKQQCLARTPGSPKKMEKPMGKWYWPLYFSFWYCLIMVIGGFVVTGIQASMTSGYLSTTKMWESEMDEWMRTYYVGHVSMLAIIYNVVVNHLLENKKITANV